MRVPQRWRCKAGGGWGNWPLAAVISLAMACQPARGAGADRQPPVWVKLNLESVGFPGISSSFLSVGASMLTVHFLDGSHLLVTYGTRGLVRRIPGDPVDDDDRMVAGEVVELPSGKVLARTEWHMHDHGRYLWNLGQGRFLLRIGDSISMIAPLAHLGTGDPFRRISFPHRRFHPNNVQVSPDQGVVTLETLVVTTPPGETLGDAVTQPQPKHMLIEFYRYAGGGNDGTPLQVTPAGGLLSPEPLYVPIDADGALWATEFARNSWDITFDGYEGKSIDAVKLESTCDPQLQMVTRSEFVAISCRGSEDRTKLALYGMDGHEAWEEPLGAMNNLSFALAPEAARFAISRSVEAVQAAPGLSGSGIPERQEVRVYQAESGDLLLRTDANPALKTAENYDLSADGMLAAVVREGAIVVYRLPELSKQDQADMALAAKSALPPSLARIKLPRVTAPLVMNEAAGTAEAASAGTAANGAAVAGGPTAANRPTAANGPAGPGGPALRPVEGAAVPAEDAPRKPPTLLNPGERAEFPARPQSPQ